MLNTSDIDAVIAWVDGNDPNHARKRAIAAGTTVLTSSGGNPRRWEDNDEISICLASIEKFAPWIRKVWVITDNQRPPLTAVSREFAQRVEIVDHKVIFRGHEALLPTFNSFSIEMMMWRIPGLAEQFIYFNDDMFFAGPTRPEDLFVGGKPVLRGSMVPFKPATQSVFRMSKENGARAAGVTAGKYFSRAHVGYCLNTSVLADHFAAHPDELVTHAAPRFREEWQMAVTSLHANLCIQRRYYMLPEQRDWHFLSVKTCKRGSREVILASLRRFRKRRARLGCVNDIAAASAKIPRLLDALERYLGLRYPLRHYSRTAPARILRLWRAAKRRLQSFPARQP